MKIAGKKIVFLGDSITEGCGTSDISKTYWKLLEINDGCISYGYGIGGTRIAKQILPEGSTEIDLNFRSRVPQMEADADIVVVFGGTNDYAHGNVAFGSFENRSDDTFYGGLHALYTDLINKYPKSQIIVMTPTHRLYEKMIYNECGIRAVGTLKDYVDAIKEVAEYYSIPVLDLYSVSGMQPEIEINRTMYMPDGLHPSDEGHKLIYAKLKEFINTL